MARLSTERGGGDGDMTDGGNREVEHSSRLTELIHLGALTEPTRPDPEKAMNIHPYLPSSPLWLFVCRKAGTGGAPLNDPLPAIAVERGRPSQ